MSFELTYYLDSSKFEEYFEKLKKEVPLRVSEEDDITIAKNKTPKHFIKLWIHSQTSDGKEKKVKVVVLVKSSSMKDLVIKIFGHPEAVEKVKPTLLDFALAVLKHRKEKNYDEIIDSVADYLGLTKKQVMRYIKMLRSGALLPSSRPEIRDAYALLEEKKK